MNRSFFRLIASFFALAVMVAFLLSGCTTIDVAAVIGTDEMNVVTYDAFYDINPQDLTQITTISSYVFIAEVVSYDRTEYADPTDKMSCMTYYEVRVKENIKGNLIKDADIELKKCDGLIKGTNKFRVAEGDILPRPGATYLFAAEMVDDDLYCSLPNMVVEITADEKDYLNDETVKKYIEACKTVAEGVENGNKYKSRYDAGGN